MTGDITGDEHTLARDLAEQAGQRLIELRGRGGDPDVLRKAGDRLSHEFLTAELAARRPGDVVLSEEGADNPARLSARRVWIVDPLDGTREFGEPGRTDWAVHVALWERSDASDPGDGDLGRRGRAPRPGPRPVHARSAVPHMSDALQRHRCPSWREGASMVVTVRLARDRGGLGAVRQAGSGGGGGGLGSGAVSPAGRPAGSASW